MGLDINVCWKGQTAEQANVPGYTYYRGVIGDEIAHEILQPVTQDLQQVADMGFASKFTPNWNDCNSRLWEIGSKLAYDSSREDLPHPQIAQTIYKLIKFASMIALGKFNDGWLTWEE